AAEAATASTEAATTAEAAAAAKAPTAKAGGASGAVHAAHAALTKSTERATGRARRRTIHISESTAGSQVLFTAKLRASIGVEVLRARPVERTVRRATRRPVQVVKVLAILRVDASGRPICGIPIEVVIEVVSVELAEIRVPVREGIAARNIGIAVE